MTVHFICRGNVLRSVIAEAYLNSLKLPDITATSSGSVADEFRESNLEQGFLANTQELLARHGLSAYAKQVPQQLTQDLLNDTRLAICMNPVIFEGIESKFNLPPNTTYWDIVDIGEGQRIAKKPEDRKRFEEEVFNEITAKVDELTKQL